MNFAIPNPPSVPRVIHRFVVDLCHKIAPGTRPLQVLVRAEPDAQVNECFFNVRNKIARDRGDIEHGWAIWERPGLFVEGEFHAVWVSPDKELLDVTAKVHGESAILFLPDPKEVFDEQSYVRRDNIRLAQYDHPAVHAFIRQCQIVRDYEESCTDPENPRQFIVDEDIYKRLLRRQAALEFEMIRHAPGRNTLCRCGSGRKFKRCCGAR